jgi:hypothetical protein
VDAAALLRLAAAVPVLTWALLPLAARWLLLLDAVPEFGVLAFELPLLLLGPAAALVPLPELALLPLPAALLLLLPAPALPLGLEPRRVFRRPVGLDSTRPLA